MSFAYSMIEIENQNQRFLLAGLAILGTVLLLWALWFFLVPIGVVETSPNAVLNTDGSVTVDVSPAILNAVEGGDAVTFQTSEAGLNRSSYPARVARIDRDAATVTLLLEIESDQAVGLRPGLNGQVAFEVARLTPAQFVLATIGGN